MPRNGSEITMLNAQHLVPGVVLLEMNEAGAKRAMPLSSLQVVTLAMMAGGFITIGALFGSLFGLWTLDFGRWFYAQPSEHGVLLAVSSPRFWPRLGAPAWGILQPAIGNLIGAFFLLALPFWVANTRRAAALPVN